MNHPFPYPPMSGQALAALTRIEGATSLKGLEGDLEAVRAETFRHYGPSILIALLTALAIAAGLMAARLLGWLGPEVWPFALAPLAGLALIRASEHLLRGPRRVEDERRLRDALDVWSVLKRKEEAT